MGSGPVGTCKGHLPESFRHCHGKLVANTCSRELVRGSKDCPTSVGTVMSIGTSSTTRAHGCAMIGDVRKLITKGLHP